MTTPGPDGLMAVAALQRCLLRRDYAGAAKLVTLRATLDGLSALAAHTEGLWQTEAGRAYRESVAAWRAEHEASRQARLEARVAPTLDEVIGVLAAALDGRGRKRRDRAAAEWPVIQRGAA